MKKLFLSVILAVLVFSGCNKSNQFQVNLTLDNAENQKVYLCKTVNNQDLCIDSAVIMDKTAVLTASNDDPQVVYSIKFNKNDECGIYTFFTENQNTIITGDRDNMPHWIVKGCPTMDVMMAYHKDCMKQYEEPILAFYDEIAECVAADDTIKLFEINEKLPPLMEAYHNYQADFIRSQSDNYLGHYMLDLCKYELDIEVVKELSAGFTNESVYSKNVKEYIEKYERGEVEAPGCMIIMDE